LGGEEGNLNKVMYTSL